MCRTAVDERNVLCDTTLSTRLYDKRSEENVNVCCKRVRNSLPTGKSDPAELFQAVISDCIVPTSRGGLAITVSIINAKKYRLKRQERVRQHEAGSK